MKHHRVNLMILLLLCGIVFGFKAGDQHFWGRHGEARRAEVSREMVASGNWAVPHLNGEPFVTKPPLYYWAAAAAFTLTGKFDEFSARLPSLIAGTFGVIVTYFWAGLIFSRRAGLFAGIILATSFLYNGMARSAEVDMMLTCCATATLFCFTAGDLRIRRDSATRRKNGLPMFLLAAACLALGNLCKNPIGMAVPLLAVAAFILLTRDAALIWEMKPWWLLLVILGILLPWFIVVSRRVPNFFDILFQETLGRYTAPDETPHKEAFYFYIPSLAAFAPWALFLPGMIGSLLARRKARALSRPHLLVIAASLTTFLLFSSVGSKREYYLLPMYPFLAILTAKYWDDYLTMRQGAARRWAWKGIEIPVVVFAGLLGVLGIGLPIAARVMLPQYLAVSAIFGALLLGCAALLFQAWRQRQGGRQFAVLTGATVLLYLFALLTIIPEMNRYRSRKDFLRQAAQIAGTQAVIDYKYEGYASSFYMQRIVPMVTDVETLRKYINQAEPVFVLMESAHYDQLRRDEPEIFAQFEVMLDQSWQSAMDSKRMRRMLLLKA